MEINLAQPQEAVEADLPAIGDLMLSSFGEGDDWGPRLRWQYLDNPAGRAIYVNAYDEAGALMAHYAVIPTSAFSDPRFAGIKVYLSLNTAVHPKAQGKGLFKKTAQAVYDHLAALGPHVVLGVANENSVHGFITSLGFHLMGQLNMEAFFPGASPVPQAPRLLAPTPEAVRWRLGRPGGGYRVTKAGQAVCTRHFKGLPVHCILSSGGIDLANAAGLRARGSRWSCPAIFATYGPTTRFAWSIPETLRPSPFHLICRPNLEGKVLPLLNHIQTSRFELFDFDVV